MSRSFQNARGNQVLKEVALKSVSVGDSRIIVNLPINLIDVNPDNDKIFNMEDIDFLANGIKKEGFIGAIEVIKKNNGRYEILSGHRRYLAEIKNNHDTIPAIIEDNISDIKKAELLLGSNIKNRKLNPMDYARAISYYKEKVLKPQKIKGDLRKKSAEFFGISESQVHKYEALLKLIPSLQQKAERKEVAFSVLSSLTKDDIKIQEEINLEFDKFIEKNGSENLTREKAQKIINNIEAKYIYNNENNNIISICNENQKENLSNINIKATEKELLSEIDDIINKIQTILKINPQLLNSQKFSVKINKFNTIINKLL